MVARRAAHRVRAAAPVVLDEDDTRSTEYLRIELRCVGAADDLPGADTRKVRPIDRIGKLSGIDEMHLIPRVHGAMRTPRKLTRGNASTLQRHPHANSTLVREHGETTGNAGAFQVRQITWRNARCLNGLVDRMSIPKVTERDHDAPPHWFVIGTLHQVRGARTVSSCYPKQHQLQEIYVSCSWRRRRNSAK